MIAVTLHSDQCHIPGERNRFRVYIVNITQETNELYESLSPAVRAELSRYEEKAAVPANTRLIREGVIPEHLIVIRHGSVEISVLAGDQAISLRTAGEGKVLGLRAIVAGESPETEATTLEDCELVLIPRQAFLDVLKKYPEMYFAISKVLSADLNAAESFLRHATRAAFRNRNSSCKFGREAGYARSS